jgi:transposase
VAGRAGERVVDVPAKLAIQVLVLSTGHGRKSDPDDAVSVAVANRAARLLCHARPAGAPVPPILSG